MSHPGNIERMSMYLNNIFRKMYENNSISLISIVSSSGKGEKGREEHAFTSIRLSRINKESTNLNQIMHNN